MFNRTLDMKVRVYTSKRRVSLEAMSPNGINTLTELTSNPKFLSYDAGTIFSVGDAHTLFQIENATDVTFCVLMASFNFNNLTVHFVDGDQ